MYTVMSLLRYYVISLLRKIRCYYDASVSFLGAKVSNVYFPLFLLSAFLLVSGLHVHRRPTTRVKSADFTRELEHH